MVLPVIEFEEGPVKDVAKQRRAKLVDDLKVQVLTLVLRPGEDLDESRISQRYDLSRTPLREVFRELAGEGYLELRENRGARVSEMSFTTMRDFFLAAPMIYGAILSLAAENRTDYQIAELKKAQSTFVASLKKGGAAERSLANNAFHEVTGAMAGNVYLLPSFKRLLIDHARIGMTFYKPMNNEMAERLATARQQHDEIIDAIEQRDAARAMQLAESHWNLSRGQIELYVTPQSLDLSLGSAGALTAKNA